MESIIKKAIEGGWSHKAPKEVKEFYFKDIFLDPLFWQALGRACGWDSGCNICSTFECNNPREHLTEKHIYPHINYALRFHEINLTEGWDKAVEYLQEKTNPNT